MVLGNGLLGVVVGDFDLGVVSRVGFALMLSFSFGSIKIIYPSVISSLKKKSGWPPRI